MPVKEDAGQDVDEAVNDPVNDYVVTDQDTAVTSATLHGEPLMKAVHESTADFMRGLPPIEGHHHTSSLDTEIKVPLLADSKSSPLFAPVPCSDADRCLEVKPAPHQVH